MFNHYELMFLEFDNLNSILSDLKNSQCDIYKDENISNHKYIDTLILRIYRRYINGYFGKKNIDKSKINQNL